MKRLYQLLATGCGLMLFYTAGVADSLTGAQNPLLWGGSLAGLLLSLRSIHRIDFQNRRRRKSSDSPLDKSA